MSFYEHATSPRYKIFMKNHSPTAPTSPVKAPPSASGKVPAGFTLIELLVVIAIIAILAAMLLPVLTLAKARAQCVMCMSHYSQLQKACTMYTGDNHELFPPNPDQSDTTTPGYNWVGGDVSGWMPNLATGGNSQAGDTSWLQDPWDLLAQYIGGQYGVFKCPADPRICVNSAGQTVPVVRSCSANQGVGTADSAWIQTGTHSGPPTSPVTGPWLTGSNSGHPYSYSQYATFGKSTDFKSGVSPSDIWVYIDESPWTINDAGLAVSAGVPVFIDYPSAMHRNATGLSFADGHAEIHKWISTVLVVTGDEGQIPVLRGSLAFNDWYWLAWHSSRNKNTGQIP
jgi:prepilin-type N-terminal cleavage/methylation domain-containing protein